MTRLKVAVRVRPLSESENLLGSTPIINVENGDTITITNVKVPEQNAGDSRERTRRFTFDYCFHENSSQEHVFEAVESVIGKAIKSRYHSCVLAYGQSSTGKTHTMMGFPHDPGLTPNICKRIFGYLEESAVGDELANMKISVSYLEIYNEKVRDLLYNEESCKNVPLKIREHPKNGPYVQGLTEHPVNDDARLIHWLEVGNSKRRVAATLTNPQSSRSHSVFTVSCAGAKLHLVDLAGSERAGSRCYNTSRFREGANINKSLVALGNVISALAEQTSKQSKNLRRRFVPYRDSALTWLLKDTLGGNSNTVMIATVSPSSACYSETVNTLRFGQRAKLIVSRPVVIEDPKENIIRELRAEIAKLRELLKLNQIPPNLYLSTSMYDTSIPSQADHELAKSPLGNHAIAQEEDVIQEELCAIKNDVNSEINRHSNEANQCESVVKKNTTTKSPKHQMQNNVDNTTTEKLLPLMSVSSTIQTTKTRKLRKTFSVDHSFSTMDKEKQKLFGSHDGISFLNQSKIKKVVGSPLNSSTSSSRRSSLNKSNPSLKPIPQRKPLDTSTSKKDASIVTEVKGPIKVESKVDSIRRTSIKPRSQIVAAVTSRLYSKTRKKDIATDTDDIKTYKEEVPKELSICSNARLKLRELTQKALKAHRHKNEETQTDLYTVLRVKEISTDVDDLKIASLQVKDAKTGTKPVETQDAAVECHFLNQFAGETPPTKSIVITRTCSTQSDEDSLEARPQKDHSSTSISFTKYLRNLQQQKIDISSACPNTPIYTNSVNINISHNYINGNRVTDSVSDDSLEDQNNQNVCFPTPDLISNHNSLEQHTHAVANTTILPEITLESIQSIADNELTFCVANCQVIPAPCEKLQNINQPTVCASEICILQDNLQENCQPFDNFQPETAKPKVVESQDCYKCDDCIILQEPLILKSIMKLNTDSKDHYQDEPSSCDEFTNTDIPDSLEYHMANKQVRFRDGNPSENQRMCKAMSCFLEEATTLMTNLTTAASKVDNSKIGFDDMEFEVTVNGLPDLRSHHKKRKCKHHISKKLLENDSQTETISTNECFSQTSPTTNVMDTSTQYQDDYLTPINKYEVLLEESCKRLDEKINRISVGVQRVTRNQYFNEDSFVQPTYNPWDLSASVNEVEDSSIESAPLTFSDYGSLPRKTHKRHRTPTCSPSAFLKQLTTMRKQVIESSREELLRNNNTQ